eukprot:CAMPEP_0113434582 /NCGR_PEP_ID=MMETSP0013_2-20120614/35675_1 /TAXON_ID=2843 ORGANISM="Skeletonema costatum, Strain 1716" /NCGR_SAMPLE_ID=MMETSP0013_2 /ASSEMBLY_ACC=CAM_ASM_000158 /LENGTH=169 /DNA_ID=CAMNT_0000324611 /DNA_START=34 /DNA_END=544 /DNA_ORIENTATION=+ /assembly_acc=CAM_ASM_000158
MKLFTAALSLAIAAQNQTPANSVELPNLRGVADIALTDGHTCQKGEGKRCSTSSTAADSHKCCAGLTCEASAFVAWHSHGTYNGFCVADETALNHNHEAQAAVAATFATNSINCDGEDGEGGDLSKCTSNEAYQELEGANCNVKCGLNFAKGVYLCSNGGDEDEDEEDQ